MASLETKLTSIAARSSMGVHIMYDGDSGMVQIKLKDNDYISCSGISPYYSGWHVSVEAAADKILEDMDWIMYQRYGDGCKRIFRELLEGKDHE